MKTKEWSDEVAYCLVPLVLNREFLNYMKKYSILDPEVTKSGT